MGAAQEWHARRRPHRGALRGAAWPTPPSSARGTPSASKEMYHPQYTYGDEATTIYPCGHSVVLYNSEAKDQELIPGLPQTKGITALALAPSSKWLCVAERGLETAQIGVYDVIHRKKKRVVQYQDIQTDTIVHMAFSHDGKYLLTQGVVRNGP